MVISLIPAVSRRAETLGSNAKILRFRVTGSGTKSLFAGVAGVAGDGRLPGGGLLKLLSSPVILAYGRKGVLSNRR